MKYYKLIGSKIIKSELVKIRSIAQTKIKFAHVSTMFHSMNYNRIDNNDPILFETMVFGSDLDGEFTRYRTLKEALDGHEEMVDRVRENVLK